ncbi:MAG: hypothetical protein VB034_08090 [Eubacteriales bacterium]|nr:hypothetical protein [Eubacteriales bacterium]
MEKLPNNPNCELSGTKYCQTLNMHACSACTIRESENKGEIKSDLDLYESLLPQGGIARLFQSRECQFCKTPAKGRRKGYAILDMAHPEPRRVQKWLFGKRAARIGTMVPVQMSVCTKCRTRFLTIEYLPMLVPVMIGILALFVFSSDAVKTPLVDLSMFAPFGGWVVSVLLGALAGKLTAKSLEKRWDKEMYMDVMQHPAIAEMTQKGWTPITAKSHTKLLFSKSRLAKGLGTAEDSDFTE